MVWPPPIYILAGQEKIKGSSDPQALIISDAAAGVVTVTREGEDWGWMVPDITEFNFILLNWNGIELHPVSEKYNQEGQWQDPALGMWHGVKKSAPHRTTRWNFWTHPCSGSDFDTQEGLDLPTWEINLFQTSLSLVLEVNTPPCPCVLWPWTGNIT